MKQKPKILQCARTIHEHGGISSVAYFLEKEFDKKHYQTECFTIESIPFGSFLRDRQIKNIFLAKIYLFISVLYYTIFGSLILYFKHKNNTIIICHNDVLVGDIYINHGLHKSLLVQNGYLKMFLKNPLHLFLYIREEFRHRFSNHKVIITFSKEDAKELKSLYPIKSKIIILPNGIDTDKFYNDEKLRNNYRKINQVQNNFIMIFIGHEFERKGLKYIVNALPYLDAKIILWVVGGNESMIKEYQSIALKLKVEKRIKFWGYKKNINELLNASDVMVLASSIEPWGLVGLEAMSTNTPFVSTATHGSKEYLCDGKNGFFIKQEAQDIAKKINILFKNDILYNNMCKESRKTAKQLSWHKVVDKYIEIIQLIVKDKNA